MLPRFPGFPNGGNDGLPPLRRMLPLPGYAGFHHRREWRVAALAPYGCRCRGFLVSRFRGNDGLRPLCRIVNDTGLSDSLSGGNDGLPPRRMVAVAGIPKIPPLVGMARLPPPRRMVAVAGDSWIPAFAGMTGCGPCRRMVDVAGMCRIPPLAGMMGLPPLCRIVDVVGDSWIPAFAGMTVCTPSAVWLILPVYAGFRIRGNDGLPPLRRMVDVAGICWIPHPRE